MTDIKKTFDKEYNRVEMVLDNFSLMGIDVTNLYKELENIVPKNMSLESFQTQVNYEDALNKLENFKRKLPDYEVLFKIKNFTVYLSDFISKDINEENVNTFSSEVILILEQLNSCDSEIIRKEKEVLDLLFDLVYKVIKLEFMYFFKSNVLDYIVSNKTFIPELNKRVLNDVRKINDSINVVEGMDSLKEVLFERGKLGINGDYVSENVFKALIYSLDNKEVENIINQKITYFSNEAKDFNTKLKSKVSEKNELCRDIKLRRKKWFFSNEGKRFVAFVLSVVICCGGVGMFLKKIKKQFDTTHYLTEYVTSINGELPSYSSKYYGKLERDYSVTIVIGGKEYDLTRQIPRGTLNLEKDYIQLSDLVEAGYLDHITNIDLNSDFRLTITTQNVEDNKIETDDLYSLLVILCVGVDCVIFSIIFSIFEFEKVPKSLSQFSKYMKEQIRDKRSILEIVEEAKKLIFSNDELKRDFFKFCTDNESILKDYIKNLNVDKLEQINEMFNNFDEQKLKLKK